MAPGMPAQDATRTVDDVLLDPVRAWPHHVAKEWVDRCKKPSSTTAGSSCASAPSSAKRSSGSVERDDLPHRCGARARAAVEADRRVRRHRGPGRRARRQQIRRHWPYQGDGLPVPGGQPNASPPPWAVRRDPWSSPGRGRSELTERFAPSSPTASTSHRPCSVHRLPGADRRGRHQPGADRRHSPCTRSGTRGRPSATPSVLRVRGTRVIYKDGWWACNRLDKAPWDLSPATPSH